jgi:UDP-N-acetylglucosamine--N-acetylmuramyl-(pentapeptide) pyrophosphoryl-undecaprenol N-acetylglucosamine transferase
MKLPPPETRFKELKPHLHLLVVGGSLGASPINKLVPQALALLPPISRPVVYHQTGEKHLEEAQHAYERAGIKVELTPFIKDMDKAYAWADIVLCRSGALTVTELCTVGLGAILVPFPHAIDDHQTANANFMAKIHAAWLIQQKDLSVQGLASVIKQLTNNYEKCISMAQSAYNSRKIDSTEKIVKICAEVCP